MKKLILTAIVLMSLVNESYCQKTDNSKLINLFNKVDTTLNSYIKLSSFIDRSDNIDFKAIQSFKNLFVKDAMVIDEIYPAYYSGDYDHPERLIVRTVDEYANLISANFPNGLIVKLKNSNISFSQLESNKIFLVIEKSVKGKTKTGLRLENHDTIEMELIVSSDYQTLKIAGTKLLGSSLMLSNDLDRDFKQDEIDKCPKQKGLRSEDGCPIIEESPHVAKIFKPVTLFSVALFFGKVNNSFDFQNNLNSTYSNASDFSTNLNATPEISDLKTTGFEANIGYFPDEKIGLGLGIGIQYQLLKGNINKSNFDVTYKATDQFGVDNKQHIFSTSNNTLSESFVLNQLSVPVCLMYKKDLSKKIGFQLDAGLNLILSFKGNASPDDNFKFDYEAVYHYDNISNSYIYSSNSNSKSDWNLTQAQVSKYSKSTNETNANFNTWQAEGYNVGLNQNVSKSDANTSIDYKGKTGLILRPSFYYILSPKMNINIGAVFMTNSYTNQANVSQYYLTKSTGEYNTTMRSIDNIKTTTYGLNIGFSYKL